MRWIKKGAETTIEQVFLRNIGVSCLNDVNDWFKKSYNDGYRIDKLDEAASLVNSYKEKKVTIVGDYDADGVTSTSILYLTLRCCGFKNVSYRIPRRFSEGFASGSRFCVGK